MESLPKNGDLPFLASRTCALIEAVAAAIARSEASDCREGILRVKDHVRAHPGATHTVKAAAAIAGMSPSHFDHVFTKESGESFIRFVIRVRMERAGDLLVGTTLRVYEIAREVGYENPNYFSTAFRQTVGVTPQEARESGRSRPREN